MGLADKDGLDLVVIEVCCFCYPVFDVLAAGGCLSLSSAESLS